MLDNFRTVCRKSKSGLEWVVDNPKKSGAGLIVGGSFTNALVSSFDYSKNNAIQLPKIGECSNFLEWVSDCLIVGSEQISSLWYVPFNFEPLESVLTPALQHVGHLSIWAGIGLVVGSVACKVYNRLTIGTSRIYRDRH